MRVTERAHEAVRAVVRPGDTVVDATVGNGHDALFLARLVGGSGLVIGFDVQNAALQATQERLARGGTGTGSLRLVSGSHEKMAEAVKGPVAAVMFNLGYLPGGDHALTTQSDSTVAALEQSLRLLRPGGVLSIVCYRGHPGGAEEAEAVCRWAQSKAGTVVEISGREESQSGPFLVLVKKA